VEFREAMRLAWATLWNNRLRSFLTVLGNVVAVLSVITVVSVIQGLNRYVAQEFLSTGSHVFTLTKFGIIMNYEDYLNALKRPDLTVEDAEFLEGTLALSSAVVPRLGARQSVKHGRLEAEDAPVGGVGADYPLVGDFPLADGRDLTQADVQGRAAVAVIGSGIRDKIFGAEDPIGKEMRIGGFRYRVVGVLKARGGGGGESRDDQVLVPITTLLRQFRGRSQSVDILVQARDPERMAEAQEEAALQLKIRQGRKPWEKPDFDVMTDEQLYSFYQNATQGIYGLLVGVVSLSLLIGGIVIMNIMLVSVTERTREIGIRKAVGARRRDIVIQFLVESVLLALAGGVIGVLGGIGGALTVRATTPLPAAIQVWSVLVGLLLASSVGLFFGIYPAWRASRLAPISALRYEN
jgi:putative ABC transport system permease protein